MASFVATYNSSTGQPRNLTLKAADLVEAKRLLRRRGIKAIELKAADTGKKPPTKTERRKNGLCCRLIWTSLRENHRGSRRKLFLPASSQHSWMPECRLCAAWI